MCGSLKEPILYSKLAKLKHDLKIYNTRLTDNLKKGNVLIGSLQSAVKMYFVIGEASKQK